MGKGGGGGEGLGSAPPPTRHCTNPLPVKHLITIQDGGIENLIYLAFRAKITPALQASRYVDDTLTVMPDLSTARDFLNTLNHAHTPIKFTMDVENGGMLPFLGIQLLNRAPRIETKVFVKPTNSGLLLHYHSHVDNRYKRGLLTTMLDRAYLLSSSWSYFTDL